VRCHVPDEGIAPLAAIARVSEHQTLKSSSGPSETVIVVKVWPETRPSLQG